MLSCLPFIHSLPFIERPQKTIYTSENQNNIHFKAINSLFFFSVCVSLLHNEYVFPYELYIDILNPESMEIVFQNRHQQDLEYFLSQT